MLSKQMHDKHRDLCVLRDRVLYTSAGEHNKLQPEQHWTI